MVNLKLIETMPRWRIAVVALVARFLGVTVHVEGIPFGSRRCVRGLALDGRAGSA